MFEFALANSKFGNSPPILIPNSWKKNLPTKFFKNKMIPMFEFALENSEFGNSPPVVIPNLKIMNESLAPFLAISLIHEKQQSEGDIVEMPLPSSEEEIVWGADDN